MDVSKKDFMKVIEERTSIAFEHLHDLRHDDNKDFFDTVHTEFTQLVGSYHNMLVKITNINSDLRKSFVKAVDTKYKKGTKEFQEALKKRDDEIVELKNKLEKIKTSI